VGAEIICDRVQAVNVAPGLEIVADVVAPRKPKPRLQLAALRKAEKFAGHHELREASLSAFRRGGDSNHADESLVLLIFY
jgi:hypothetical protein